MVAQKTMEISIIKPLSKRIFVSVKDPLILVAVTLSYHIDFQDTGKARHFGSKPECSAINN